MIPPHVRQWWSNPAVAGTICMVLSAGFYSATNVALRALAVGDDADWAAWVACVRAFPSAVAAWGVLAAGAARGEPLLPPARLWGPLVATGCVMHFGGNLFFQWSLSLGGLALAVPITLGVIMLAGALLGRMLLGEAITPRSLGAMAVLVAAVVVLSQGAPEAADSVARWTEMADASGFAPAVAADQTGPPVSRVWAMVMSVLAACLAGISYGLGGVVIRKITVREGSVTATLMILSTTGVVGLGLWSLLRMGPERLCSTTPREMGWMLVAGVCNAIAFFACSKALQLVSVVRVNAINSSQAALCSLAGVWLFQEPLSWSLAIGVAMTIGGIAMMEARARSAHARVE